MSRCCRGFLQRESLPADLLLPTPLRLRRKIEQLPAELRDLRDEHAVRQVVNALNTEIAAWLRTPEGPRVVVRPVNTEDAVRQWRTHRGHTDPPATPPAPADDPAPRSRRRHRRRRRT